MYTITKEFKFEAAHSLFDLPPDHKCGRQHGHSYRVEVELSSTQLNEHWFVLDYGELDEFADYLKNDFDHFDLNELDILTIPQTSAECLAKFFYDWCKQRWVLTSAVRVSETKKTWAEYKP